MKIGISLKKNSYTPEGFAYQRFLENNGWDVQFDYILDECNDINLYFMGTRIKKASNIYSPVEIHEYHSLSTPPFAHQKNLIKKFFNSTPSGRIFLNETMKNTLDFRDNIPSINRDMGVDQALFMQRPINPEFDLIYSGSIQGRVGLLQHLKELSQKGFKILVIGNVNKKTLDFFRKDQNIKFTGKVTRSELPSIYQRARAGLNYTPNLFPFNIQTSTKTLEYCAAQLGVVSNKYPWVENFAKKNSFQPFWLDDIIDKDTFDNHEFTHVDVTEYEWNKLLSSIDFEKYLLSFLR